MGKELLEELRLLLGNQPCTEEPAVGEGAGMDGMEKVQNHFCQSTLNPQLDELIWSSLCRRHTAEPWTKPTTLHLELKDECLTLHLG